MSLEEFVEWADKATTLSSTLSRFRSVSRSSEIPSQSRQYSVCLQPAVLPSVGPFISSLISSGVGKYSGFRLVDCVSVFDALGHVNSVPGSKEDIFKSKISLIEKRRLMRFLTFTAGDFEDKPELLNKEDTPFIDFLKTVFALSEKIASILAYALAFCVSSSGTDPFFSLLYTSFYDPLTSCKSQHCPSYTDYEDTYAQRDATGHHLSSLATMVA